MFNRRDTSPTYDYEELQRRHAEFKERKRQEMSKKDSPAEAPAAPGKAPACAESAQEPIVPAEPEITFEPEIIPEENLSFENADIPQEIPVDPGVEAPAAETVEDTLADDVPPGDEITFDEEDAYSEEEYPEEEYAEEAYEDEGDPRQNPNPFDSFFSVFAKIKGKFSKKKAAAEEDEYYGYEDEFSEENLPADDSDIPEGEYDGEPAEDQPEEVYAGEDIPEEEYVEEAPVSRRIRFGRRREAAPADESEIYTGEDAAEDIAEDVIAGDGYAEDTDAYNDNYDDAGYDEDAEAYEDYADEEYGDEFDSEAPAEKKIGKFGRFMRLFVVPVDEDEDEPSGENWDETAYDDGDYPEEDYGSDYDPSADLPEYAYQENTVTEQIRQSTEPAEDAIEGGLDNMADQNRINPELSRTLAADLENPGMSRRERRELAARLAAEEAARKAEEEKMFADVEDAAPAEDASESITELFVEEPLEADVVEDVASGIVEIKEVAEPSIDVSVVDEPTREFKPVSKMSFDEFMDTVEKQDEEEAEEEAEEEEEEVEEKPRKGLFGRRKSKKVVEEYDDEEDEEDYDDDEDEEEEEVEEKPRKGLFGRRKSKKVVEEEYDDEDEDYEDEDEEDYEDEEEEEEVPVKRSRKSRREKRRSRRDRYDDDEDYDDEDDYDAYDDEEEYDDEYEDDYEEYDDDEDYDEGGSSFGRSILRFFIVIISLVLIFAILLLGANILNVIDVISLTPLADRLPEQVSDILLFSEDTKHMLSGGNDDAEIAGDVQEGSTVPETVVVPEISLEDAEIETSDAEDGAAAVEASAAPETADAAPATVG